MKFFKNMFAFKLNDKEISEEQLTQKLEKFKIVPCGRSEEKSIGWTEALDEDDSLAFKINKGIYLFNLKTEEKSVPAAVIGQQIKERIKETVKNGGEYPSKKEIKSLKEELKFSLLSQAFVKPSYTVGYLDFKNGVLVVDAASPGKADKFTSFLRDTLGTLDLELINPDKDVSEIMGDWLKNKKAEKPFEIGTSCMFKEKSGERGKISISQHILTTEEMIKHLENENIVDKMDMVWQKRVSFSLNSAFRVSKIKFLDIVVDQIQEDLGESEDQHALMQASMQIMVEDFAEIITDLQKSFS